MSSSSTATSLMDLEPTPVTTPRLLASAGGQLRLRRRSSAVEHAENPYLPHSAATSPSGGSFSSFPSLASRLDPLVAADSELKAAYQTWWLDRTLKRLRWKRAVGALWMIAGTATYALALSRLPSGERPPRSAANTAAVLVPCALLVGYAVAVRTIRTWTARGLAWTGTAVVWLSAYALLCSGLEPRHVDASPAAYVASVYALARADWCYGVTADTAWTLHALPVAYLATAGATVAGRSAFGAHVLRALLAYVVVLLGTLTTREHESTFTAHVRTVRAALAEEEQADAILQLTLPKAIVARIKDSGRADVRFATSHEGAAVLFVEICGVAALSALAPGCDLLAALNDCFSAFDECLEESPTCYKVETVGSVYMVACGADSLTAPRPGDAAGHAHDLAALALRLQALVHGREVWPGTPLEIKCGLHCGRVIGGVIGLMLPRYRLFGDTVNTAARMETNAPPGAVMASSAAAALLTQDGRLRVTSHKTLQVKGKGEMTTFLVGQRATPASADGAKAAWHGPSRRWAAHQLSSFRLAAALAGEAEAEAESLTAAVMLSGVAKRSIDRGGSTDSAHEHEGVSASWHGSCGSTPVVKGGATTPVDSGRPSLCAGHRRLGARASLDRVTGFVAAKLAALAATARVQHAGRLPPVPPSPPQGPVDAVPGFSDLVLDCHVQSPLPAPVAGPENCPDIGGSEHGESVFMDHLDGRRGVHAGDAPDAAAGADEGYSGSRFGLTAAFHNTTIERAYFKRRLDSSLGVARAAVALFFGANFATVAWRLLTAAAAGGGAAALAPSARLLASLAVIAGLLQAVLVAAGPAGEGRSSFRVWAYGASRRVAPHLLPALVAVSITLFSRWALIRGHEFTAPKLAFVMLAAVVAQLTSFRNWLQGTAWVIAVLAEHTLCVVVGAWFSGRPPPSGAHVIEIVFGLLIMWGPFTIMLSLDGRHIETHRRVDFWLEIQTKQRRTMSTRLVHNMLPAPVVAAMTQRLGFGEASSPAMEAIHRTLAWDFECVHILQSDICDFTKLGTRVTPVALCKMLHELFTAFDESARIHDVHKVETVGDAYLASTSCLPGTNAEPVAGSGDATRLARLALTFQDLAASYTAPDGSPLRMRIGLHAGAATAGIVGASMLRYHLFGATVDDVVQLEQASQPARVRCSLVFAQRLWGEAAARGAPASTHPEFHLEPAAPLPLVNAAEAPTFWVTYREESRPRAVSVAQMLRTRLRGSRHSDCLAALTS